MQFQLTVIDGLAQILLDAQAVFGFRGKFGLVINVTVFAILLGRIHRAIGRLQQRLGVFSVVGVVGNPNAAPGSDILLAQIDRHIHFFQAAFGHVVPLGAFEVVVDEFLDAVGFEEPGHDGGGGVDHAVVLTSYKSNVDRPSVGLLGADLVADAGRWQIQRIYTFESWNPGLSAPLDRPGLGVSEGEYLVGVDGARSLPETISTTCRTGRATRVERERLDLDGKLVRVDIDPTKIDDFYPAEIGIQAGATETALALRESVEQDGFTATWPEWSASTTSAAASY